MSEVKQMDRKIAEQLHDTIPKNKKITTKELAEKLSKQEVGSKTYIKQRLHINRDWYPKQVDKLETFRADDNTGGEETRYWRINK